MTIDDFVGVYRVRVRRDGCGEPIIRGKPHAKDMPAHTEHASHLYENGDGRFGVLMCDTKGRWSNARRKLVAAGFEIRQEGDSEGTALFDPANALQARMALKLAHVRVRRQLTEEQRQKLLGRLANARGLRNRPEKPPVQAKFSPQADNAGQGPAAG